MKMIYCIGRLFSTIFRLLYALIGVLVGSIFGAFASFLLIASIGDGFSFSTGALWMLMPGTALGAYVGTKIWPAILGLLLGESVDVDVSVSEIGSVEPGSSGTAAESSDENVSYDPQDHGKSGW